MEDQNNLQLVRDGLRGISTVFPATEVTKANIEALATKLAEEIKDPYSALAQVKVVNDLMDSVKTKLNDRIMESVKNIPEAERRVGKVKFSVVTRTNIAYNQDEAIKEADTKLKSLKAALKSRVEANLKHLKATGEILQNPVPVTETTYIKWDIPEE